MLKYRIFNYENSSYFQQFVLTVWAITFCYAVFYFFTKVYFSAGVVAFGVVFLSPLVWFLDKYKKETAAKMIFLFSCNLYIFGTSLGIAEDIRGEFYAIPAFMLALLITEFKESKQMIFGAALPLIFWSGSYFFGTSVLPSNWVASFPYPHLLRTFNFLGSFSLAGIFLSIFYKTIKNQRDVMISVAKMSSLGEMAGGIAHEINTPLAIIQLKTKQIVRDLQKGPSDLVKVNEDLKLISLTTERIAKIISGLRNFSRDGSRDSFKTEYVSSILNDTLELCKKRLESLQIELRLNIQYPADSVIECRSIEISQVLLNLIQNASDAISQSAQKWVEISLSRKNDVFEVRVTDSGTGIPQNIQKRMMQPFFTTKEVGKGTGLGLSISRGIIESHQGQLFIDNHSPNTCFVILLPCLQNKIAKTA